MNNFLRNKKKQPVRPLYSYEYQAYQMHLNNIHSNSTGGDGIYGHATINNFEIWNIMVDLKRFSWDFIQHLLCIPSLKFT